MHLRTCFFLSEAAVVMKRQKCITSLLPVHLTARLDRYQIRGGNYRRCCLKDAHDDKWAGRKLCGKHKQDVSEKEMVQESLLIIRCYEFRFEVKGCGKGLSYRQEYTQYRLEALLI